MSAYPAKANIMKVRSSVREGPEADDETERLGIPKANDKLELLR